MEFPENANTHIVTFPVISNVDPDELRDIIIAVRENIIEMVEQQCIECDILVEEISVECNGELLLFTDLYSKNKLSGIYELPQEVPIGFKHNADALQSMGVRKRTIGNVDYEEEIIRVSNLETTEGELYDGYLWADREKMKDITLSGPHRKWIEEILEESG